MPNSRANFRTDGAALLDGPNGARYRVPLGDKSLEVGSEVYFAVRRDLIELRRGEPGEAKENSVHADVAGVEYQGIYFKVTLPNVAGEEFIVVEPEARFFDHPVAFGDGVVASWRPEDAQLLEPDLETAGGAQPYADDSV